MSRRRTEPALQPLHRRRVRQLPLRLRRRRARPPARRGHGRPPDRGAHLHRSPQRDRHRAPARTGGAAARRGAEDGRAREHRPRRIRAVGARRLRLGARRSRTARGRRPRRRRADRRRLHASARARPRRARRDRRTAAAWFRLPHRDRSRRLARRRDPDDRRGLRRLARVARRARRGRDARARLRGVAPCVERLRGTQSGEPGLRGHGSRLHGDHGRAPRDAACPAGRGRRRSFRSASTPTRRSSTANPPRCSPRSPNGSTSWCSARAAMAPCGPRSPAASLTRSPAPPAARWCWCREAWPARSMASPARAGAARPPARDAALRLFRGPNQHGLRMC